MCWCVDLQEARGGEVVVREGLLVQPPTITTQPTDAAVDEGATVQLSIAAVVRAHTVLLSCLAGVSRLSGPRV